MLHALTAQELVLNCARACGYMPTFFPISCRSKDDRMRCVP